MRSADKWGAPHKYFEGFEAIVLALSGQKFPPTPYTLHPTPNNKSDRKSDRPYWDAPESNHQPESCHK